MTTHDARGKRLVRAPVDRAATPCQLGRSRLGAEYPGDPCSGFRVILASHLELCMGRDYDGRSRLARLLKHPSSESVAARLCIQPVPSASVLPGNGKMMAFRC